MSFIQTKLTQFWKLSQNASKSSSLDTFNSNSNKTNRNSQSREKDTFLKKQCKNPTQEKSKTKKPEKEKKSDAKVEKRLTVVSEKFQERIKFLLNNLVSNKIKQPNHHNSSQQIQKSTQNKPIQTVGALQKATKKQNAESEQNKGQQKKLASAENGNSDQKVQQVSLVTTKFSQLRQHQEIQSKFVGEQQKTVELQKTGIEVAEKGEDQKNFQIQNTILRKEILDTCQIRYRKGFQFLFKGQGKANGIWIKCNDIKKLNPQWLAKYFERFI